MKNNPRIEDQKRLLLNHRRRLQILKEKQALRGINVDADILIEIEDIEAEIENLQAAIELEPNEPQEKPKSSTSALLTPAQQRRLRQEKQGLEKQRNVLHDKIRALRDDQIHENRSDEIQRLKHIIKRDERLLAELENKLSGIEKQLGEG